MRHGVAALAYFGWTLAILMIAMRGMHYSWGFDYSRPWLAYGALIPPLLVVGSRVLDRLALSWRFWLLRRFQRERDARDGHGASVLTARVQNGTPVNVNEWLYWPSDSYDDALAAVRAINRRSVPRVARSHDPNTEEAGGWHVVVSRNMRPRVAVAPELPPVSEPSAADTPTPGGRQGSPAADTPPTTRLPRARPRG
jgi:hypothetical protein